MKVIYIISMLIIYLEMIFKIFILNKVDVGDVVYTILFSMQTIMVLNLLCNIFKEKVSKILFIILSTIITIYFGVQAVFYNLFSVPFSFSTLGLAKGAFGFTDMVKEAIGNNIFNILIILIPLVLGIVLISMKKITFEQYNKKTILFKSGILVLVIIFSIGMILVDRKDTYSPYNLYFKRDAQEKNIETFGVLNSTLIDIQRTIFGFKEEMIIEVSSTNIKEEPEEEFEENEIKKEITYNKLDLNLNAINSSNKSLQQLIEYIEATEPTNKNEYTGYFEGKNLIFILAEGFNEIGVDKELTPTLYELTNSGFVFNNFYSPVFLSTTGGEFQATTGLIPTQTILNLWKTKTPSIGYGLGNSFKKIGYTANAYHDWTYNYYDRQKTMKTLGFDSYIGMGNGLEKLMDRDWIPSDEEMMKVTPDFYTSEEKFVTYYVTVSGHAPYNFGGGNSIALKHKKLVKDLPYSQEIKAYLATQIELDRALETLIKKLEEKHILDDTVIALVGDHYPYTLSAQQINQISDYEKDEIIEVNKSNFIVWNSNMRKKVEVDKVGSQIDVLPTLLNLFGIEYDSRLIVGQDILSDAEGIAIFSNRSWATDYGTYFAAKDHFIPKEGVILENEEEYITKINNEVSNKFTISNSFIKYKIYDILLEN